MKTYQIKKGESFASVAKRYGLSASELAAANGLRDPFSVAAGTKLQVPDPSGDSAASSAQKLSAAENRLQNAGTYSESAEVRAAENALAKAEAAAPGSYRGQFEASVKKLYDDYLSAPAFSYSARSDPLYLSLRDQTLASARRASEDSLAGASALTGGMASSYARAVAADAYSRSIASLADRMPELYNAAYDRYRDANELRADRLSAAMKLDAAEYDRYRDTVADYFDDLNYYYAKYGDLSKRDYEKYRDNIDLWQKDRSYYYTKNADAIDRERRDYLDGLDLYLRERDFEYQKSQDALAQKNRTQEAAQKQENYNREFEYRKSQDALAQKNRTQEAAQKQQNYEREFALQLRKFEQDQLEFAEQQRQFALKQQQFEQEKKEFEEELAFRKYSFDKELNYKKGWWYL